MNDIVYVDAAPTRSANSLYPVSVQSTIDSNDHVHTRSDRCIKNRGRTRCGDRRQAKMAAEPTRGA